MTVMSDPHTDDGKKSPSTADDIWARRRGKNLAILATILGLAVLFFIVTILRMG